MQGDHHVDGRRGVGAHIAMFEAQARLFQAGRGGVAQAHHVFAQLHAGHLALQAQAVAQVVVHGEGQVALARAEIDDMDRQLRITPLQRRVAQGVGKHLDELVDLLPLARHRRHQLVPGGGHAQIGEERPAQFEKALLLAVMASDRRLALDHLADEQARLVLLAEGQLHVLGQRQQVGVPERRWQQAGDMRQGFGHRQVLGDIAGLVGGDERQAGLAFDRDRANGQALQLGFLALVLAQQQLDQGVLHHAGVQQGKKLFTSGDGGGFD